MDSLSYIDSTHTSPRRAHHVKVSACGGIFLHPWVAQGRRHRRGLLPHLLIASWAFILFFFFFFFKRNISTCDTQCGRKGSAFLARLRNKKTERQQKRERIPRASISAASWICFGLTRLFGSQREYTTFRCVTCGMGCGRKYSSLRTSSQQMSNASRALCRSRAS